MKRDLRLEMTCPHSSALVWKALTEAELLSRWLMSNDFLLKVGHEFQFKAKAAPGFDGVVHCVVLGFAVEQFLEFSWKGGPIDTVVRFTLAATQLDGMPFTKLILEHKGFEGWKAYFTSFVLQMGWQTNLLGENLPKLLLKMRGVDFKQLLGLDNLHRANLQTMEPHVTSSIQKFKQPVLFFFFICLVGGAIWFSRFRTVAGQNNVAQPSSTEADAATVLAAGSVEATGEGADLARQIGTVFVILRDEAPGPPYAVAKLKNSSGQKTLNFKLTEADVMMKGAPAPKSPLLKVRFDSDGDPMTELPHDLSGTLKGFVLGERDLHLFAKLVGNANGGQQVSP